MNKVGDDELIYLIKQNNEEAKRLLFFRYENLLGYFLSIIEKKYYQHLESDELLSILLHSIEASLKTYNMERGIFLMYLKETFKRFLLKESRDLDLFISEHVNQVGYNDEILYSLTLNDIDSNEEKIDVERILKIIKNKNEEAYNIILLWIQGYKNKEIAEMLNIDKRHVEYVFNNIIKYCRMILKR